MQLLFLFRFNDRVFWAGIRADRRDHIRVSCEAGVADRMDRKDLLEEVEAVDRKDNDRFCVFFRKSYC